jgi:uncharacterized membrane protein YdjX (TVP38/TMEM64 family)
VPLRIEEPEVLSTPPPGGRARIVRNVRISAVLVVVALLLVAQRFGVFHAFSDPARVKETLVQLGPRGYLAFVVAFTVLQPFGLPGTVFVMAAPLIWTWPVAFALSMAGTMAASVVGFSFARFVGRDWISALVPPRFERYEAALERRAFSTVFLLRLAFWMPQWLHVLLGVSRVRFATHFWGSFFGYLLPLFLVSYFGQKLFDALRAASREAWIAAGLGTVAVVVGVWIWRQRAGRAVPSSR